MQLKDILFELETAPGTGDGTGGTGEPPTSQDDNTDPANQPPQSIPYSRFKEVNDSRKQLEGELAPFKELQAMGYDAEQLHRLAQWELEFTQEPVKTWLTQASALEELPQEVKDAIAKANGVAVEPPTSKDPQEEGKPSVTDEPPEWAKGLLEDHEERKKEKQEQALSAEAEASKQLLDGIIEAWETQDKTEGIATPRKTMLAHIVAAARTESTPDAVLAVGRRDWLEAREETLQTTVVPGNGNAPRTVPGGGSGGPPAATSVKPKSLSEASRLAEVFMKTPETPVE